MDKMPLAFWVRRPASPKRAWRRGMQHCCGMHVTTCLLPCCSPCMVGNSSDSGRQLVCSVIRVMFTLLVWGPSAGLRTIGPTPDCQAWTGSWAAW